MIPVLDTAPDASVATYVKVSSPTKSIIGSYVNVVPVRISEPEVVLSIIVNDSTSPTSTSDPDRVPTKVFPV
jgi:hypothetical protein